ncbi:hypothetical protein Tco_0871036 [Tanacetum coccineum]
MPVSQAGKPFLPIRIRIRTDIDQRSTFDALETLARLSLLGLPESNEKGNIELEKKWVFKRSIEGEWQATITMENGKPESREYLGTSISALELTDAKSGQRFCNDACDGQHRFTEREAKDIDREKSREERLKTEIERGVVIERLKKES